MGNRGAKSTNTSNIVANVTSNYVSSVVVGCKQHSTIGNQINLTGQCTLSGAHIDLTAEGVITTQCLAQVSTNVSAVSDLTNNVAQISQASASGFGLAPANSSNILDLSLQTVQNVLSYVTAISEDDDVVENVLNCSDQAQAVQGTYINATASLGENSKNAFKISQVASLTNSLNNTVSQASKATSKDFFGQLADMGTTALICLTVLGSVAMMGVFYMGGKTVGNASSIVSTLLSSPVFWGGGFLSGGLVNGYLYSRNSRPYKKEVPPQGQSDDPKSAASNRKGFLVSELSMVAGGMALIILFSIFGGSKKTLLPTPVPASK